MMLNFSIVLLLLTTALVDAAKTGDPCPTDRLTVCFKPIDYKNQDPKVTNLPVQHPPKTGGCLANYPHSDKQDVNDAASWGTRCCLRKVLKDNNIVKEPFDAGKAFTIPKTMLVNGPIDKPNQAADAVCN